MKIKLDENIPASLTMILVSLGHDVDSVKDEKLVGATDEVVWKAAQNAGRFFVTQDLDFSDTRKYSPGTHSGVLLVRLWMPGRSALISRITALFTQESVESWKGCFVIFSESKLRILRPAKSK
jgi:hypothetical protein